MRMPMESRGLMKTASYPSTVISGNLRLTVVLNLAAFLIELSRIKTNCKISCGCAGCYLPSVIGCSSNHCGAVGPSRKMAANIPWKDELNQMNDIVGWIHTNESVVVLKMEPSSLLYTGFCWCCKNETIEGITTAHFIIKLKYTVIDWEPSDH